ALPGFAGWPPSARIEPAPDSVRTVRFTEPPEPSPEALPDETPPFARIAPSTARCSAPTSTRPPPSPPAPLQAPPPLPRSTGFATLPYTGFGTLAPLPE